MAFKAGFRPALPGAMIPGGQGKTEGGGVVTPSRAPWGRRWWCYLGDLSEGKSPPQPSSKVEPDSGGGRLCG